MNEKCCIIFAQSISSESKRKKSQNDGFRNLRVLYQPALNYDYLDTSIINPSEIPFLIIYMLVFTRMPFRMFDHKWWFGLPINYPLKTPQTIHIYIYTQMCFNPNRYVTGQTYTFSRTVLNDWNMPQYLVVIVRISQLMRVISMFSVNLLQESREWVVSAKPYYIHGEI